MYKDLKTGYFYAQDLGNCVYTSNSELEPQTLQFNTDLLFINCGGTIVSTSVPGQHTGVEPRSNLLGNFFFRSFLQTNKISYVEGILKLSEKWTLPDYFFIKDLILKKIKHKKRIIFTFGTDYVSFFAPWIELLSQEMGFKSVILISQRSLDRPSAELPHLLKYTIPVLNKLKFNCSVVLTYNTEGVFVHNPFEIKKFHTTSKKGFYSNHQTSYPSIKLPRPTRFKVKTVSSLTQMRVSKIEFETIFSNLDKVDLRISRGVGNPRISFENQFCSTMVNNGPTNSYLYNGLLESSTLDPNFTWESVLVLYTLTNYAGRN